MGKLTERRGFLQAVTGLCVATVLWSAGCGSKREPEPVPEPSPEPEPAPEPEPGPEPSPEPEPEPEPEPGPTPEEGVVFAHIGGDTLRIKLADNPSAQAFADLLAQGDVTVAMHDYGGFEKVGDLPATLPRTDEQITTQPGDVILYLGRQITIYYDVNSWDFTRLGRVQDVSAAELKRVLDAGGAEITAVFSLT